MIINVCIGSLEVALRLPIFCYENYKYAEFMIIISICQYFDMFRVNHE